jgi:hypothetical protein
VGDLDAVAKELEASRNYSLATWAACVSYVEARAAEGDELASGLMGLVRDAEKRGQVARLAAVFAMPCAPPTEP